MIEFEGFRLPEPLNLVPAVDLFNDGWQCWCQDGALGEGHCEFRTSPGMRQPCDDCLLCCNYPDLEFNRSKAKAVRYMKQLVFKRYAENQGYCVNRLIIAPSSDRNHNARIKHLNSDKVDEIYYDR